MRWNAPELSREHLIYFVALVINVALDKLESSLPYNTSEEDWARIQKESSGEYPEHCAYEAGRLLCVLYADQTDDGMDAEDAVTRKAKANILEFFKAFPSKQIAYWNLEVKGSKGVSCYHPDYRDNMVRQLATRWIDNVFGRAFFRSNVEGRECLG